MSSLRSTLSIGVTTCLGEATTGSLAGVTIEGELDDELDDEFDDEFDGVLSNT